MVANHKESFLPFDKTKQPSHGVYVWGETPLDAYKSNDLYHHCLCPEHSGGTGGRLVLISATSLPPDGKCVSPTYCNMSGSAGLAWYLLFLPTTINFRPPPHGIVLMAYWRNCRRWSPCDVLETDLVLRGLFPKPTPLPLQLFRALTRPPGI